MAWVHPVWCWVSLLYVTMCHKRAFVPERTMKAVVHPSPFTATAPQSKLWHVAVSTIIQLGNGPWPQELYQAEWYFPFPLSHWNCVYLFFLQPENHRLTLIWNDTTLNETKLTPYYTVQCLNVNNQSYLVFVDTFRSVQLNSVDVEVIVTSTEEVMLSVSQQYYRETIGPIFMKLGGRL